MVRNDRQALGGLVLRRVLGDLSMYILHVNRLDLSDQVIEGGRRQRPRL